MHTRSGRDVSPVRGDSSSSSDEETDAERVRGRRRLVTKSKARGGLAARKAGQASSSVGRNKIPLKKFSMKKKLPKQQGINVPKIKGKSNGGHFTIRFSVHRIRGLKFSKDQIGWIKEAGLGSLLALSEFSMPAKFVTWIMKHIIVDLREFRLKDKVIVFDKQLVCNILGVPSGKEPVKLTCTADEYESYQEIREPFLDEFRGKMPMCIEVLTAAKDKATFMRAFMLLALGSLLCPARDNVVNLRYLHSLKDISKIKSFDWAGHILDELMNQVSMYQSFTPPEECGAEGHNLGSCLAVLAIAYMDHLDIPADRAPHKINYSVPRICHVTKKDFEFVTEVDRRSKLNAYGHRPFRMTSPYPTPVPMSGYIPSLPPMLEEESVVPSLKDRLDGPSTSSHPPVDTTVVAIKSLPEEYLVLLAEYNSLVEKDVDELAEAMVATMKEQAKMIIAKRDAELACMISHLNNRNDVTDLATNLSHMKKPSNDNANVHPPPAPTDEPGKKPSSPLVESTEHPNTSSPPIPPEERTHEPIPSPPPMPPNDSTKHSIPSSPPIQPEESANDPIPSSPPIQPEESTNDPIPFPPPIPPEESTKEPNPSSPPSPSFDCSIPSEPEFEYVCEGSRSPTPTGDTTIEASNEKQTGSSTFEKRKRVAFHLNLVENPKKLKADDYSKEIIWNKFLAKRAFANELKIEGQSQPPPFIDISGFHVTYDEFYDSFKAMGLVGNNVMASWSFQFNLDQLELFEMKKTRVSKFAFSQLATDYLSVDPASFKNDEACMEIYNKINERWTLAKMDLMFFPIVFENHWVLLCVSMFMKEIAFFDFLNASQESPCLQCAKNLVKNFAATTMKYEILEIDVSKFRWIYPTGYPIQKNLSDCGMYTMDYMEAWDGKEIVASSLEKWTVLEYRKHAAALLLLSAHNTVKLDDFMKKYNAKETFSS